MHFTIATFPITWPAGRPAGRGLLLNAAVMPTPGLTYRPEVVETKEFVHQTQRFYRLGTLVSFIGYPQTADFIARLCSVPVPVSRESCTVLPTDTILICRLRYRLDNPATKGAPVHVSDFEFIICHVSR